MLASTGREHQSCGNSSAHRYWTALLASVLQCEVLYIFSLCEQEGSILWDNEVSLAGLRFAVAEVDSEDVCNREGPRGLSCGHWRE